MISMYLYYYDDYNYIILNLNKLNFRFEYRNDLYEKYEDKDEFTVVIVYKELKILAIQQVKNKIDSKIKGLSLLKKVNLLDKKLFIKLFEQKFSQNLCNISIDILGSEEELVEYEGYKLLDMNLLEQFDFYDCNSNTKIRTYALQPKGYRYLLKVSSINKLEFNEKYDIKEIENVILKLIVLIKLTNGGDKY
ncbi:hypothetical protein ACQR2W_00060 [Clostridium perfringens]